MEAEQPSVVIRPIEEVLARGARATIDQAFQPREDLVSGAALVEAFGLRIGKAVLDDMISVHGCSGKSLEFPD